MRILIVSGVYPPEPVVSAQTSSQIAEEMASRGHQVQVIAPFPSRPGGKLYPGFRRNLYFKDKSKSGLPILRCWSAPSRSSTFISRFLENITFGVTAGLAILFLPRPDVIYSNTWPVFASGMMALAAKLRGIPYVLSIQDVYPESLLAQGRLTEENSLVDLLRWMDCWIALQAEAVILITERFLGLYRDSRRVPANRLYVIPNWAEDRFAEEQGSAAVRRRFGIAPDKLLMVYGGNISAAAGVDALLDALTHLPVDWPVCVLVAGDGPQLEKCQKIARDSDSLQIVFLTPWPVEETALVLTAADFLLLPTFEEQSLVSVPSKLIAYMLAGRPVIAQAHRGTEIEATMLRAGCGWVIPPGSRDELARVMGDALKSSSDERAAMGQSGRDYALKNLARSVNLPKIVQILERIPVK